MSRTFRTLEKIRRLIEIEKRTPKPAIIELGGLWKKVFKRPRYNHRPYPDDIQCCKCGNLVPNYAWFYVRTGKNPKYYCEECYEGLWHE